MASELLSLTKRISLTKKKKNLKDVTIHQSAVDDKTLKYGDEKKFTHPSK